MLQGSVGKVLENSYHFLPHGLVKRFQKVFLETFFCIELFICNSACLVVRWIYRGEDLNMFELLPLFSNLEYPYIFRVPRSFGEQTLETNGLNPKISGLEDYFPFKGADFRLLV